MNRTLYLAAFSLGLAAVGWVGFGYIGSHPLALTMTGLIAAFYLMGAVELQRFQQATASLVSALATVPEQLPDLGAWLARVHPSLQNAVRLRVEGERVGLPGPAMTPYLVGLLVLLGMLGTFLGMVVTLNGAVLALESTTDLQAVRASLAAPVKGLGLAFGTSVAGVAASAMLGLMSALCRRDRLQAAQALDTGVATGLRAFSNAHRREEAFKTQQAQARALPELVDKLQAMMVQMERQGLALNDQLQAGQEGFHRNAERVYTKLAESVDHSLQHSLTESARLAGAAIQPVVEATMSGMAQATAALHARVADTVQQQLDGVSARFEGSVERVATTWHDALAQHRRSSEQLTGDTRQALTAVAGQFEQHASALLGTLQQQAGALAGSVEQAHERQQAALAAQDAQRLAAWHASLAEMAAALQREWQRAGEQGLAQQARICETLAETAGRIATQAEAQASRTLAEIAQLMQATSEAPRAAAEVMGELRRQLSDGLARDNALLEERCRTLATLDTLLDGVNRASTEQRGAIDALVASSAAALERAGAQFARQMDTEAGRLGSVAAQVTGSAVEVASLGDAFGAAVARFAESNETLVAHLQRVETSLDKSLVRSDEQLAYYVAQARELIDLSIMSQKQIVEDMQQLAARQAQLTGEAA